MSENDHRDRVERIKKAFGCRTDIQLAERLKSYAPNITRWKQRGFYPIIANLIDEFIKENQKLKKQIKQKPSGPADSLAPQAKKRIEHIGAVTGKTTDAILDDAIDQFYETVMVNRIGELAHQIVEAHGNLPEIETLHLYCELLKVLKYTYDTAEELKIVLTRFGVPLTSGKPGKWRVAAVRSLLQRCGQE